MKCKNKRKKQNLAIVRSNFTKLFARRSKISEKLFAKLCNFYFIRFFIRLLRFRFYHILSYCYYWIHSIHSFFFSIFYCYYYIHSTMFHTFFHLSYLYLIIILSNSIPIYFFFFFFILNHIIYNRWKLLFFFIFL